MAEPGVPGAITVEVAYALPERQWLHKLMVPVGTTASEAVARAESIARHAGDPAQRVYGMFGRVVAADHRLRDGDRVELLRPLLADPKEVRRALAAQGRTMGKPAAKRRD